MESLNRTTGSSNPADLLAKSSDEVQKSVLAAKKQNNIKMEQMIAEKEWDLAQKQAFLKENAQFLH